ncbi:nuclear transport factor 2 family protein [Streptomyces sp. NPDC058459]|uniref:nuclear transport factor 2 family protein n=1 Tax=Streptomyces sp. NPDC058459 TaxID=3346508 RepID=UPI003666F546
MPLSNEESNKEIVLKAFDLLFNKRDYQEAERYWSPNYIQHSAHIPAGREGLFDLVRSLPDELRHEVDVVMADGDTVVVRGRFSGHGLPAAWIAVDFLRLKDGVFEEHWDVIQDEATAETSRSGLPMYGDAFPEAAEPLTTRDERLDLSTPLATMRSLLAARSEGDTGRAVSCYEPDAVVVTDADGTRASGPEAVRAFVEATSRIPLIFGDRGVVSHEQVALHHSEWRLELDSGTVVGRTSDLLRKQPNGDWLIAVDNPYGTRILDTSTRP